MRYLRKQEKKLWHAFKKKTLIRKKKTWNQSGHEVGVQRPLRMTLIKFGLHSFSRDMHLCCNFQMGTLLMVWNMSKKALKWVTGCWFWLEVANINWYWRFSDLSWHLCLCLHESIQGSYFIINSSPFHVWLMLALYK